MLALGSTRCMAIIAVAIGMGSPGCGGSGSGGVLPSGVAARVGGYMVSKAAVAHWTPIEAILSQELIPKGPIPRGMVPDPPGYGNCIVYQRKIAENAAGPGGRAPSVAQLKRECKQRYEGVRAHILNFLIAYGWLREEAAAHGLKVNDAEVSQRYRERTRAEFTDVGFRQFLARTGLTEADEMLRFKDDLLVTQVVEKVFKRQPSPQKAYPEFLLRWSKRTECAPGYVTPNCREYRGPLAPES
jgi:hypothetical protein